MSKKNKKSKKEINKIEENVEVVETEVVDTEVIEDGEEVKNVVFEPLIEDDVDENAENSTKKEKKKKNKKKENKEETDQPTNDYEVVSKKRWLPIVGIAIIIFIVISALIFGIVNKVNKNVYNNVYLNGQNISNMNQKQVETVLNELVKKYNNDIKVDIVQNDKVVNTVVPNDIKLTIDVEKTYKEVFKFGRDSNILVNNYNIFKNLFSKKNIELKFKYDVEELNELTKLISDSIENKVVNDKYEIVEDTHKLVLTRGKDGNTIDEKVFEKEIIEMLKKNKTSEYEVKLSVIKPQPLNAEAIYKEVKRDAKNAEVIEEAGKKPVFKKEIYGHDIDKNILLEEINKLQSKNPSETLELDLNVIEPKIKYKDIAWTKFENTLGSLTTRFPASNKNRATNLSIALAKLNEIVIMPGEVFSYNKVIGDPNAAKGYKPAATFKGSTVVDEVGGGICQTVSTLYNAVLYSNLQIVSRRAHGLAVGYVRPALDATMYYPYIDFKFKNTRSYPIKIKTSFSWNGNMSISIMGTKEDVEYDIDLSSAIVSTKPFETVYETDPNMAPGTQKVKSNGVNGYTAEAYKITKLNGKVIKRELLSVDTYKPTTKIVVKGPDAPAPVAPSVPTEVTPPADNATEEPVAEKPAE